MIDRELRGSPSRYTLARALVTGGAGFIGSHLVEALLNRGHEVVALDDLSTGSEQNIAHLRSSPRLTCVFDTVLDSALLLRLTAQADIVFHLAAAVGVRRVIEQPLRTIETNIHGTEAVLKAAAKHRTRVFLASTSEVYGKNGRHSFQEDSDLVLGATTTSRWSYACSKAIDEFLALAYRRETGLPVTIARLFNVVGPRQTGRYGMVLPTFVRQALDGSPITVFGTGQQRRCFCDVSEAVGAILSLAWNPAAEGEVVNIGSDEEITIGGLADTVRERLRSPSTIQFIPYERAYGPGFEDMTGRRPSLEKLTRLTGGRPQIGIGDIIDKAADHMRSHGGVGAAKSDVHMASAEIQGIPSAIPPN